MMNKESLKTKKKFCKLGLPREENNICKCQNILWKCYLWSTFSYSPSFLYYIDMTFLYNYLFKYIYIIKTILQFTYFQKFWIIKSLILIQLHILFIIVIILFIYYYYFYFLSILCIFFFFLSKIEVLKQHL
jgi:hypothetical protein